MAVVVAMLTHFLLPGVSSPGRRTGSMYDEHRCYRHPILPGLLLRRSLWLDLRTSIARPSCSSQTAAQDRLTPTTPTPLPRLLAGLTTGSLLGSSGKHHGRSRSGIPCSVLLAAANH